jgi:hypothetical protein
MSAIRREEITRASNQITDGLTVLKTGKADDEQMGSAFISIVAGFRSLFVGIASDLNEINERQLEQELKP